MIVGVLTVRDEAYYLPTFLAHVAPYVDGLVALDDGSTDATRSILEAAPRMLDVIAVPPRESYVWHEEISRKRVLERAHALGARWILALDPDERVERRLLRMLRPLAWLLERADKAVAVLRIRELWETPYQYRRDGVWGRKRQGRLFRMPAHATFDNLRRLHGPWFPAECTDRRLHQVVPFSLYHLKMIRRADREARRDRYQRLDPEAIHQPTLGYGYLTDDLGLEVAPIPRFQRYDYAALPAELISARRS